MFTATQMGQLANTMGQMPALGCGSGCRVGSNYRDYITPGAASTSVHADRIQREEAVAMVLGLSMNRTPRGRKRARADSTLAVQTTSL